MTGPEVEFIPGYSLFFTNRGQLKMYELLGVRNYTQFIKLFNDTDGLDNDQLTKIVYAGLVWEKKGLTLEELDDLIENEFYIKRRKTFEDLNSIIIDGLANSGLLDKKIVAAIRKLKDMSPEEVQAKILETKPKSAEPSKGEDQGEPLRTLT